MTCLDMQKQNLQYDTTLASILRQAEKRHTVYEKVEKSGRASNQKINRSRGDEVEWEFCLRRYFEYLDSRSTMARSDHSQSARSENSQNSDFCSSQRTSSMTTLSGVRHQVPVRNASYRAFRQGKSIESYYVGQRRLSENLQACNAPSYNEIYTRPRRNSTASTLSTASNTSGSSRTNSWTLCDPQLSPITDVGYPRSANFSLGSPWQQVAVISAHDGESIKSTYALPSNQEALITQAWNDIVSTTPFLSPGEARAYIQGRLAGLDPSSTAQIKRSLSMENMSLTPAPLASLPQCPAARTPVAEMEGNTSENSDLLPRSGMSATNISCEQQVESQQLSRAMSAPTSTSLEPKYKRSGQVRSIGGPARPKAGRRGSKKRLSGMRIEHTRSLSTIIERPSSVKSKASKAESHVSRKSIFSLKKEKLPTVPDTLQIPSKSRRPSESESLKSTGSSTLRGSTPDKSRIVELEDLTEDPPNSQPGDFMCQNLKPALSKQQSQGLKSTMVNSKHPELNAAMSKTLPLTPTDLPPQNRIRKVASLLGFKKSRKRNAVLQPSMSTPQLASAMRSAETLRKGSLDCLRRNGSKSTLCLVAIQEGPEQPFQVWLSALPYIEGRAATPIAKV
jgi:hypothetical protein